MSVIEKSPTPRIFAKQLFADLRALNYVHLDPEQERYYQSLVNTFKLATKRKPNRIEQQRMRVNTLMYLYTDLEHSPEYQAIHEFTRTWHDEYIAGINSKAPYPITSTIELKTDRENGIHIVKGPYEYSVDIGNMTPMVLDSYSAYMAIDRSGDEERVLAKVYMAPETFALEHITVGVFKGTAISRDPRSAKLLDEDLLPRLLGGAMGYNGIKIPSTLDLSGFQDMGNFVNFAYKHGGAVYVFNEKTAANKVYLLFRTLDEYERGIGKYCGDEAIDGDWAILIAYKPLPIESNVQIAECDDAPEQIAEYDTNDDQEQLVICGDDGDAQPTDNDTSSTIAPELTQPIMYGGSGKMEVTKFELNSPDSDGDMRPDEEVEVVNTTESEVRLIRTSVLYINSEGAIVTANSDNDRYENLAPGESTKFDPGSSYAKVGLGLTQDDTLMRVFATLYSREFHKIGEIAVPADKEPVLLRKTLNSAIIAPEVTVVVSRGAEDSDGTVGIEIRCGLANKTDQHLDKVELKTYLLDRDDEVIEGTETAVQLAPHTATCIEDKFWRTSKNRLKKSRCRFSLSVYIPVLRETAEAISTRGD